MRNVRTIPHCSTSGLYLGVPDPIFYDATAQTFLQEYNNRIPANHLIINTIPADEVHEQKELPITIIAGYKDNANYFDLRATNESDSNSPERWLREFDQPSFPADGFPEITQAPPVPFPQLNISSASGTDYVTQNRVFGTTWVNVELGQTINGNRVVLRHYQITRLFGLIPYSRLSIVRNQHGSAYVVGCVSFAIPFGQAIDASGGAMQAFFIDATVSLEDCGAFCGRVA